MGKIYNLLKKEEEWWKRTKKWKKNFQKYREKIPRSSEKIAENEGEKIKYLTIIEKNEESPC